MIYQIYDYIFAVTTTVINPKNYSYGKEKCKGRTPKNARRKNGRIKDKSVKNVPGPIKEGREIREGKAKNKKRRNRKMGKGGKAANDTKPIKKNCIMQSGERAVFSPRFLLLLHRRG